MSEDPHPIPRSVGHDFGLHCLLRHWMAFNLNIRTLLQNGGVWYFPVIQLFRTSTGSKMGLYDCLILKLPITKNCRLLCHLLVILKVIFANSVDPDHTAPLGAV